MNTRTRWLLKAMAQKHPIGITRLMHVPGSAPTGVGMQNLRALQRMGLVAESPGGIFTLTDAGVARAAMERE